MCPHVLQLDALYATVVSSGFAPEAAPADAEWGERYFHLLDPNGHELSFASPIADHPRWAAADAPKL